MIHLTECDLGNDAILKPSIPKNYWTKIGVEDSKTPRVCAAPTIRQCLLGMSKPLQGLVLNVYQSFDTNYIPAGLCPDSTITNEVWYLSETKFVKSFSIKIGEATTPRHFYVNSQKYELWEFDYKFHL